MSGHGAVRGMVCLTCRRALEYFPPARRWLHVGELVGSSDHPAIPVDPSELDHIDARCDFCSATDPTWVFDTEVHVMAGGVGVSDPGWAACDACCDDVVNERWNAVATRAVEAAEASRGELSGVERELLLRLMLDLHRGFDRHRKGEPTRV